MSMTWTMLTSLIFFSQEVSRMGIPDQNLGAAAQLALRGSVM